MADNPYESPSAEDKGGPDQDLSHCPSCGRELTPGSLYSTFSIYWQPDNGRGMWGGLRLNRGQFLSRSTIPARHCPDCNVIILPGAKFVGFLG